VGRSGGPHEARPLTRLHGATEIELGTDMACALFAPHRAPVCWRSRYPDDFRRREEATEPEEVKGIPEVRSFRLTDKIGYAVTTEHELWTWDLATNAGATRIDVPRVTNVEAASHACAIDESGAVWCWGSNVEGECGGPAGEVPAPRRVTLPGTAKRIAVA